MSGIVGMLLGSVLPTTGIALGASGAVFGLLAVAVVLVFRPDLVDRDQRLRWGLLICLVAAVFTSFLPGVSLAGHAGGLIGGFLVALFTGRRSPRSMSQRGNDR